MGPKGKAETLARVPRPEPWRDGDVMITVLYGPALTRDGHLMVELGATVGRKRVTLDNPFIFVNPPIMVRDGDELRTDPARALVEIVTDAVRHAMGRA